MDQNTLKPKTGPKVGANNQTQRRATTSSKAVKKPEGAAEGTTTAQKPLKPNTGSHVGSNHQPQPRANPSTNAAQMSAEVREGHKIIQKPPKRSATLSSHDGHKVEGIESGNGNPEVSGPPGHSVQRTPTLPRQNTTHKTSAAVPPEVTLTDPQKVEANTSQVLTGIYCGKALHRRFMSYVNRYNYKGMESGIISEAQFAFAVQSWDSIKIRDRQREKNAAALNSQHGSEHPPPISAITQSPSLHTEINHTEAASHQTPPATSISKKPTSHINTNVSSPATQPPSPTTATRSRSSTISTQKGVSAAGNNVQAPKSAQLGESHPSPATKPAKPRTSTARGQKKQGPAKNVVPPAVADGH